MPPFHTSFERPELFSEQSSVEELPEQPLEEQLPEQPTREEAESPRESIETVSQLMDLWRMEYETAKGDRKAELAYRIVKMGEAISTSGLSAGEVKIRESEPGVLGFYVPSTGEIALTPAGLDLPPIHFTDVLVHEATHAGITTGKKIADEGLTQIITEQKVAGAMSGIYEREQQETEKTFSSIDTQKIIDTYDFEKPRELIELYLQTEWHDAWKEQWGKDPATVTINTEEAREHLLTTTAREWVEKIEQALETAAPRLLERAGQEGFDFTEAHTACLEQLALAEEIRKS